MKRNPAEHRHANGLYPQPRATQCAEPARRCAMYRSNKKTRNVVQGRRFSVRRHVHGVRRQAPCAVSHTHNQSLPRAQKTRP
jgi:hypothetical protein